MFYKEGFFAFYRSFPVTLFMNIPWGAIMIMTNETLKPIISKEENHNFLTFSLCAGYSSFYLINLII